MARETSGWHREDIKSELRKRFGSMRALARAWGYDISVLSQALSRPVSTVIERRIADALQVSPAALWPERWTPEGRPLRRACRPEASGPRRDRSSQNGKAA
jgi:lambda repressor-like predicted transcriptional regulator